MKALRIYIAVSAVVLVWAAFDVMLTIDLPEDDCKAKGYQIVDHGNGNKVCRFVRK